MTDLCDVGTLVPTGKKAKKNFRLGERTMARLDAIVGFCKMQSRTEAIEELIDQAWKSIPPHALPVPEKADDDNSE